MKLRVSKKPRGIHAHAIRESFIHENIGSDKSNINTALVSPDFDNNKLPNIKNIFFVDKIKSIDANAK